MACIQKLSEARLPSLATLPVTLSAWAVAPGAASGHWSVKVDRSAWLALLVRGHQPGRPEMIAAHGTPVLVTVGALVERKGFHRVIDAMPRASTASG